MSFQGKQLSEEITEFVIRLKEYHDDERKAGKFVPTKDPAGRTAKAIGLGVATVKRIMARYAQNGEKIVVRVPQRPGRPPSRISPNIQPVVRQFIRTENLDGRRVSIDRVGSSIQCMALRLPKRHFGGHLNDGALPMEKDEGEIA